MNLKFFYDNYKLDDIQVNSIYIKDNKLYLNVIQNAHLELIANGYRPEMNVDYNNTFIFNIEKHNHKYNSESVKEIRYEDNKLIFILDGEELIISDNEVEVR